MAGFELVLVGWGWKATGMTCCAMLHRCGREAAVLLVSGSGVKIAAVLLAFLLI